MASSGSGNCVPVTLRDYFWNDPFFSSTWDDFDRMREQMMKNYKEMVSKFEEEMKKMESNSSKALTHLKTSQEFKNNTSSSSSPPSSIPVHTSPSSTHRSSVSVHHSSVPTYHSSTPTYHSPAPTLHSPAPTLHSPAPTRHSPTPSVSKDKSFASLTENHRAPWSFPRRWMMPSLFSEEFSRDFNIFQDKDEQVIRIKDDYEKFEISLDTHQYRPDELKVNVKDEIISIEGKHEEKFEDSSRFISRQFVRKYSLPKGCKPDSVNSNLSSDGVLVITAPKVKPIDRVGERSVPITMK